MKKLLYKIPIVRKLLRDYEKTAFQKKWRKANTHNYTSVGNRSFPIENVEVGKYSYGELTIQSLYVQPNEKLIIGNFVSIAPGVQFLLGVNHQLSTLTTYPLYSRFIEYSPKDAVSKGEILIEDEVWLGTNALIMSGIKIGKGAIIAAGSIVTKDVPPYSIFGGNPAKLIKFRFSEEIINELLDFHLTDLGIEFIKKNINYFYENIKSVDDVRNLKRQIENLNNSSK